MEIIAEIGQNHNGDMKLARELIVRAKECGADVAKFQLFKAESVFGKQNNPWYDYNCQTQLSLEDVRYLAEECEKSEIEFCASVFNIELIDWLEQVKVKRYKIASRSVSEKSLLNAIARTNKPLIISLGMWAYNKFPEINTAAPVDYLFCVSKYPAKKSELNLSRIDFSRYSGFSDHTTGIAAAVVAMARGAKIIEKHFTLDKKMSGPDHSCSMTPKELKIICDYRDEIKKCL